MDMPLFSVYCGTCTLAGVVVWLGLLAANIAMLLVIIIMLGACCIPGRKK